MNKRGHHNDPNKFCYVCAQFISGARRNFTTQMQEVYWTYFKTTCSDFDKDFTPSYICTKCQRNLYRYKNDAGTKFPFSCPAIWTENSSHDYGVCYFCSITKPTLKRNGEYFDCDSCKIPKLHLPDLADRQISSDYRSDCESFGEESENDSDHNHNDFKWSMKSFNDFCKELKLSKSMSKKCLSMLRKDPYLKKNLHEVTFREINHRSKDVQAFFTKTDEFVYCNDIEGLVAYLDVDYTSNDWCLFIDSSITGLKAALMYKNHLIPTIPIAFAKTKEDRSSIEKVLELINYHSNCWLIMCDLKVLNFIMGLKSGYAKYPCFHCMFDSRNSGLDFDSKKTWPKRDNFDKNPLVPIEKIAFPFLHIKLGIFQKFVKTIDKESACFQFICSHFKKSDAKLINGIFTGPEIRYLMKNKDFPSTMTDVQLAAWLNFCDIATNVLGKSVTTDWREKVDSLMSSYQNMGCPNVTIKMHLLFKHKDKYEPYIGTFSDEHGERLHQEMEQIEKRYGRNFNKEMIAEYVWSLKRDTEIFNFSK